MKQSLVLPFFSFPGSAWECMNWRLRLHYHAELHLITGQSPEDTDSQAEPGNQEKWSLADPTFPKSLAYPPISKLGRKRAICGNKNKIMPQATRAIKKGRHPLYIKPIGKPVTLFTTKTQIAMGGTITPIIRVTQIMIPNHTGSYPNFITAG